MEEEKQCREVRKGGRKMDNCFFGGRKSCFAFILITMLNLHAKNQ